MRVAVDGTEAAFIKLPALSGSSDPFALCSSGAAVRAEPMPPIGSTVTFKVHGTPDETYAYVIGESDFMPPAPLTGVSVDVHDYPTIDGGSTCDFNYGINLWVHLTGGVQDAGSAIVHNIYLNDKGTGDDGWLAGTVEATDGLVAVPRNYTWTEEHDPIQGFCVTVRTFDLAGNQASHAHRICSACRARIEPGEQWSDAVVTVMPAWSEADVVPGGQCSSTKFPSDEQPPPPPPVDGTTGSDTSGDTTAAEEDAPVERGCGCDGTGGAGSWVWGLLLVWRRRAYAPLTGHHASRHKLSAAARSGPRA